MSLLKQTAGALVIVAAAGAVALAYGYMGRYDVAADVPHWRVTERILGTIRDRSVAAHSEDLQPPNLKDSRLIALGAEHYAEMCSSCHLAPGIEETELREGLNPRPPNLSRPAHRNPAETFWTIKHGIKMSGMPAWGRTHDDGIIWAIVAFVDQLPGLTPSQYQALTGSAHEDAHRHEHHGVDETDHAAGSGQASGAATEHTADAGPAQSHEEEDR